VGVFLLAISFTPWHLYGQKSNGETTQKRAFYKVLDLIESNNYHLAIKKLNQLLADDPENVELLYHLGYCYLNTSDIPDTAAIFFELGIEQLAPEEYYTGMGLDLHLALAETEQVLLKPEKALSIYDRLRTEVPADDTEIQALIEKKTRMCQNAMFYLKNPLDIEVVNLGDKINSPYDDHSPLITIHEDNLYFTSRRPDAKLPKLDDGQYAEKIYFAQAKDGEWKRAGLLQSFFKKNEHESAASLSVDGLELFVFRNERNEGKSIYISRFDGNRWEHPVKLPAPINSDADETHASLSADKSTLFFTSNRPGGFGGMDIYMVRLNADGKWGEAINLGPSINTQYDEETPMLHADGRTFYFASEGHNSMGRMDVFYSELLPDSTWAVPVNLGYPINTPDDDFFFVPTLDKSEAYCASSRFENNLGGSDLYHIKFKENFEGKLAVIEGQVEPDSEGSASNIRILVTEQKSQRLVGEYRPNPTTGTYMMFLETGNLYEIKKVQTGKREKVEHIDVRDELAFDKVEKVVLFKEVSMELPLTPNIAKIEEKTEAINEEVKQMTAKTVKATSLPDKFTVQILALKRKPIFAFLYFKGLEEEQIKSYACVDGYTRYVYGIYNGKQPAMNVLAEIRKSGKFNDAYVRPIQQVEELTVMPSMQQPVLKLPPIN
jgi:tetratricopeptide (TPR) repeat protein